MVSINDWAKRAAERIERERRSRLVWDPQASNLSVDRMATIIALSYKPVIELLQESKREHRYTCPKVSNHPDCDYMYDRICNCGAEAWNQKVDQVLNS